MEHFLFLLEFKTVRSGMAGFNRTRLVHSLTIHISYVYYIVIKETYVTNRTFHQPTLIWYYIAINRTRTRLEIYRAWDGSCGQRGLPLMLAYASTDASRWGDLRPIPNRYVICRAAMIIVVWSLHDKRWCERHRSDARCDEPTPRIWIDDDARSRYTAHDAPCATRHPPIA